MTVLWRRCPQEDELGGYSCAEVSGITGTWPRTQGAREHSWRETLPTGTCHEGEQAPQSQVCMKRHAIQWG